MPSVTNQQDQTSLPPGDRVLRHAEPRTKVGLGRNEIYALVAAVEDWKAAASRSAEKTEG